MIPIKPQKLTHQLTSPLAITMWDFSWLERRWAGAGYEDWDLALDELKERGYNAVRIDAYPHFLAEGSDREWDLIPVWNINEWGSPAPITIRPWPALAEFVSKCKDRGIKVGLSTWFREDRSNIRLNISTPEAHAAVWIKTMELLEKAGLADAILYVDLCNEFPGEFWAPFFRVEEGKSSWNADMDTAFSWMISAVNTFRKEKPRYATSFSYSFTKNPGNQRLEEIQSFDFLDPHIWLVQTGDFFARINHKADPFNLATWDNIGAHAEELYRSDSAYWLNLLRERIEAWASYSQLANLPLITTECWGIVDYRDWPNLDWGWVKETCAFGTETALGTRRWAAVATSNFCGPQFRGMWRDIEWHQQLTKKIRQASLPTHSGG